MSVHFRHFYDERKPAVSSCVVDNLLTKLNVLSDSLFALAVCDFSVATET